MAILKLPQASPCAYTRYRHRGKPPSCILIHRSRTSHHLYSLRIRIRIRMWCCLTPLGLSFISHLGRAYSLPGRVIPIFLLLFSEALPREPLGVEHSTFPLRRSMDWSFSFISLHVPLFPHLFIYFLFGLDCELMIAWLGIYPERDCPGLGG